LSQCDAFVALTGKAFDVLLGQFISRANPSGLNNLLTTIVSKTKDKNKDQRDALLALAGANLDDLLVQFSKGAPASLDYLLATIVSKTKDENKDQRDALLALAGANLDALLGLFEDSENPAGLDHLLDAILSKTKDENKDQRDALLALAEKAFDDLLVLFESSKNPAGLNHLLAAIVSKTKDKNKDQRDALLALAAANLDDLLELFSFKDNPSGLDELLGLISGEDKEEARGRVVAKLGEGDNPTIDDLITAAKGAKGEATPPAEAPAPDAPPPPSTEPPAEPPPAAPVVPAPTEGAKGEATPPAATEPPAEPPPAEAPAPDAPPPPPTEPPPPPAGDPKPADAPPAAPTPEPPPPPAAKPAKSPAEARVEAIRLAREMFATGKKPEEIKAGIKDLLLNEGHPAEDADLDKLLEKEHLHIDPYSAKEVESANANVHALWEANSREEVFMSGGSLRCKFYSMLSQLDPELGGDKLSIGSSNFGSANSQVKTLQTELAEFYQSELKKLEETPKEKQDKAWQDRQKKCQDQMKNVKDSYANFTFDAEVIQWFANKYKRNFVTFSQENAKGMLHSVQISVPGGQGLPPVNIDGSSKQKIKEYVQALSPEADIETTEYLKGLKEAYEAIAGAYGLNLEEATMSDIFAALMKDQKTVCLVRKSGRFSSLQHSSQVGAKTSTADIPPQDFDRDMRDKTTQRKSRGEVQSFSFPKKFVVYPSSIEELYAETQGGGTGTCGLHALNHFMGKPLFTVEFFQNMNMAHHLAFENTLISPFLESAKTYLEALRGEYVAARERGGANAKIDENLAEVEGALGEISAIVDDVKEIRRLSSTEERNALGRRVIEFIAKDSLASIASKSQTLTTVAGKQPRAKPPSASDVKAKFLKLGSGLDPNILLDAFESRFGIRLRSVGILRNEITSDTPPEETNLGDAITAPNNPYKPALWEALRNGELPNGVDRAIIGCGDRHYICIRKLANGQWVELDSLKFAPRLIPDNNLVQFFGNLPGEDNSNLQILYCRDQQKLEEQLTS
jgi:hypothetical protein